MRTKRIFALALCVLMLAASVPGRAVYAAAADECPGGGEHNWVVYENPPTCTDAGMREYQCTKCFATRDYEELPPLGHNWDEWVTRKAATCTESGTQFHRCSRCHTSETRTVSALGHNYVNGVCTRCGGKDPSVTPKPTAAPVTPAPAPEQAPFDGMNIPSGFGFLRNDPVPEDPLRIVTQPEGGMIPKGSYITLTVEAAGGEGAYTYEWWYVREMPPVDASALADFLNGWAGESAAAVSHAEESTASLASELLEAWKKKNGITGTVDHTVTATEATDSSADTEPLQMELFNPFATRLSSETDSVDAWDAGTYWVVVYDEAGRHVTSSKAKVTEALYIAVQPESQNLYGLSSVTLTCRAGGGSGSYSYAWVDNQDTPQGAGSSVEIHDIGDYLCIVTDNGTGEQLSSYAARVYSEERDLRPTITLQPESVELEYREDGQYNWSMACLAQAFDGSTEDLQYQWSGKTDTGWAPISASETLNKSYDHGTFRCTITDKRNGQYVTSNEVKVEVKMKIWIWHDKPDDKNIVALFYRIEGGKAPYTINIMQEFRVGYEVYDMLARKKIQNDNETHFQAVSADYRPLMYNEEGYLEGYTSYYATYHIEVIDAYGQYCKSVPITIGKNAVEPRA